MRNDDLSYFEEEEFKENLRQYESALNEGGYVYMDADVLTDIAEYYMTNEREMEADQVISLALQLHPDAVDPQVFLARQQMFHNNIAEASRIAGAIDDQQDREVQFLWAEINIRKGKVEEADNQLLQYYDTLTEEQDYFLYDTAGVFMDYDEWGRAEAWAKRLKHDFPKFKNADLLLSDILISWGKVAEAIPIVEDILDKEPFNEEGWKFLAEAHFGQDHFHEALDAIDYLLAINEKHAQGMLIRANILYHLNRMGDAHKQYQEYLLLAPTDATALYLDAVALTNLERLQDALDELQQAMDLLEDDAVELPNVCLQISYVLSKMGDKESALAALETAYANRAKEKDYDYDLLKGHILLENHDLDGANLCFSTAIKKSEDRDNTLLMIAISWAENEYYHQAAIILDKLLQSNMDDKQARCLPYRAYCSYFLPGQPHFKEFLHQAVKCNPSLTEYLFAPIYSEGGNRGLIDL